MAVYENVAYGFADQLRQPRGIFNGPAFMFKQFVPCDTLLDRLGIGPATEFSGMNPEYFARLFLFETFGNGLFDYIDHGFFEFQFKVTLERSFKA